MSESFYHSATDFLSSPANMAIEQVMSPRQEENDDTNAARAPPATGRERAAAAPATVVSPTAHARSAEPDALARVLEMLTGMEFRMKKMEAFQARMDEDERMRGAHESDLFRSELGADFAGRLHGGAMELEDLHDRQPQQQLRRAPTGSKAYGCERESSCSVLMRCLSRLPHCHHTSRHQCLRRCRQLQGSQYSSGNK